MKAYQLMVRKERLELSRLAALEPKSSASTNSATLAKFERGLNHSFGNGSSFYCVFYVGFILGVVWFCCRALFCLSLVGDL